MDDPTAAWSLLHEPRDWQRSAFDTWLANDLRGIVEVVTGAGKTVLAELCICHFVRSNPDGKIVIVVPTTALLDQWYVSLREEMGVQNGQIATYSGEGRPTCSARVNIMVLNTARESAPPISQEAPVFLVVDECHRAGSPENARALRGDHAAALGMSATPNRDYDDGLDDFLIPTLGPVIFEYGYNEAARDGVISPFNLVNVRVDLLPDEEEEYESLTRQLHRAMYASGDCVSKDARVNRILQRRARVVALASMRVPVAVRIASDHRAEKTLVFHEEIEAAERIQELLAERSINTTIYHSRISAVIRRDNLRLFRRGAFDVLVSCRALDEGTNVPETSVAILSSSSASARQRIQRMGRVLRPAPAKSHATIYTVYATDAEERRLAREAQELVEANSVSWQRVERRG